jgi:thiol-disulfide isomerase/thioredoxin
MKYYVFIFYLIYIQVIGYAQNENKFKNSDIEFKAAEFKNNTYYLAGYYGKYTVLLDSVKASNKGSVIFKKEKKYTEGIYLLVDNDKKIVLEFMMDSVQHFSINVALPKTFNSKVTNSKINQDFFDFNLFLATNFEQIKQLDSVLALQQTAIDSLVIKNKIIAIQKEIYQYKLEYIKENPKNVISIFFHLSQPPETYLEVIENPNLLKNRNDSLNYVKNNFFKGIDFSDSRLLRNPFLETKINSYFNSLVSSSVEEITKEVFGILEKTGDKNEEMFSYLSLYFINKYLEPKIMGQDEVFINIYNRYFNNKEYTWQSLKQKLSIEISNRNIKDNLIGHTAPNLFMTSLNEKSINLFDVQAPYLVLIFWDPSCGHCIKELPKIKKIYDELWKDMGIQVFAVNINGDQKKEWKEYIEKEKIGDWINVIPATVVYGNYTKEEVDFQTRYNVFQTPVLYLLDATKKILAKKVGFENYLDIIKNQELNKN